MNLLHYTTIVLVSATFLTSCGGDSSNKTDQQKKETSEISTDNFEKLAVNPCNFIDESLVIKHFNVSAEDLEKDEYVREKLSWIDHCTYKWEKEDIEAINKRNQKKLMEAMQSGNTKNAIKVGKEIEPPHKHVGVTNLKLYDDIEEGRKYFQNSHKVPSKEDLEKLNQEFQKKANEKNLTENQKEVGKDLGGGIADNLKFKKVENLGDYAYWDDLGSKLDVLVGKIQFGVKIHTGDGTEKDIEKATIIAKEIIANKL
jgi:hypothetical protein